MGLTACQHRDRQPSVIDSPAHFDRAEHAYPAGNEELDLSPHDVVLYHLTNCRSFFSSVRLCLSLIATVKLGSVHLKRDGESSVV